MNTFSEQRTGLQKKIGDLEADIQAIKQRQVASSEKMDEIEPKFEASKLLLREAKKTFALRQDVDSKKIVQERKKHCQEIVDLIDNSSILQEALSDEFNRLQKELEKVTNALHLAEVECLGAKARALIENYNSSVIEAHKSLVYLKHSASIVQKFGLQREYSKICPNAPAYMPIANLMDDLRLLQTTPSGSLKTLYDSQYPSDAVIEELYS